jgi:hypothetical protein
MPYYESPSDIDARTDPPPPMGAANCAIRDAAFGNYVVRVTDQASEHSYGCSGVGEYCTTPSASDLHAWDCASKLFYCYRNGSSPLVFEWDDAKLHTRFLIQAKLAAPEFDLLAPGIMWGMAPEARSIIRRFDARHGTYANAGDLSTILGTAINHTCKTSVTHVNEIGVVCGTGGQQDTDQFAVVYNWATRKGTVLDTMHSEIDGHPLPHGQKLGWPMHGGSYDPGGRFFFLTPVEGSAPNQDYIWDNHTQTVYPFTPQDMGHFGIAYGFVTNNCYFGAVMGIGVRCADQAELHKVYNAFPAGAQYSVSETHTSVGAADPNGGTYPIFLSSAGLREDACGPNDICGGEVSCVSTDYRNPQVRRFCHVRTTWPVIDKAGHHDPADFYNTPRGNVSPNGRAFIFTSNWCCALGKGPSGWPRKDVFVVQCR